MKDMNPKNTAMQTGAMNRRSFVAGVGAAGAAGIAITALPGVVEAGLSASATTDSAGLISIAGRITNSHGMPEKRAYVEIMQHRVRDWKPSGSTSVIDVQSWEAPDWMGVWTDDDGVFGLHTWWSVAPVDERQLVTALPQNAEVRFNIETQDGRRLSRSLWLDANPGYMANALHDPSMLTPVAWDDRAQTAQFIADFSVA